MSEFNGDLIESGLRKYENGRFQVAAQIFSKLSKQKPFHSKGLRKNGLIPVGLYQGAKTTLSNAIEVNYHIYQKVRKISKFNAGNLLLQFFYYLVISSGSL